MEKAKDKNIPTLLLASPSKLSQLWKNTYPWGSPSWLPALARKPPSEPAPRSAPASPRTHKRFSLSLPPIPYDIFRVKQSRSCYSLDLHVRPPPKLKRTTYSVRPSDIKLIACCGDSLLTGLGLSANPSKLKNKILSSLVALNVTGGVFIPWIISGEHRQNTCICGGAEGVLSVGTMLKAFSPALVGLNTTKTLLFSRGSCFNFAMSGATFGQLQLQVSRLITKLATIDYIHLKNEWKLVFLWIGANDVYSHTLTSIRETVETDLVKAIRTLKAFVPYCIVHLMPLPSLTHLLGDSPVEIARDVITQKTKAVNEIIRKVSAYDWTSDHFRVVYQPVPTEPVPAEMIERLELVSQMDGIHPSIACQQLFAKCVWNNLFLANGQKIHSIQDVVDSEWKLPDGATYIA